MIIKKYCTQSKDVYVVIVSSDATNNNDSIFFER